MACLSDEYIYYNKLYMACMGTSECKNCGYRWSHPGITAPRCPSCKVVDYKSTSGLSCNRSGGICDLCGTEFMVIGIGRDRFCPNCGSDRWSSKRKYKCLVCGHEWISTLLQGPKRCPHSVYVKDENTAALKRKSCGSMNIVEVKVNA